MQGYPMAMPQMPQPVIPMPQAMPQAAPPPAPYSGGGYGKGGGLGQGQKSPEMCISWPKGNCWRGDNCRFTHSWDALPPRGGAYTVPRPPGPSSAGPTSAYAQAQAQGPVSDNPHALRAAAEPSVWSLISVPIVGEGVGGVHILPCPRCEGGGHGPHRDAGA